VAVEISGCSLGKIAVLLVVMGKHPDYCAGMAIYCAEIRIIVPLFKFMCQNQNICATCPNHPAVTGFSAKYNPSVEYANTLKVHQFFIGVV
jgi:hypothetical protein